MGVQNPFNKTMENEFSMVLRNCETVNKTKMSKDLPILRFISIKSMKDINNGKYTNVINKNLEEFKGYDKFNYCLLEGGHYIYYAKSKEIGKKLWSF